MRFAEQLGSEAAAIDSATLHLVAEAEGQVVGALVARLLPPEDAAKREITPELGATSLRIEYLGRGVAAALIADTGSDTGSPCTRAPGAGVS